MTLICTVRNCRLPLVLEERMYRCANRHAFDVARSGYVNLLQPQDRRSLNPGDPKEAVAARRRLFDAGHSDELLAALTAVAGTLPHSTVLDTGCGEGSVLGALQRARPEIEAAGTDISLPAIEAAARRFPSISWVIANADRMLPWADESFDLVMSITARINRDELRRVLRAGGQLIVAVAAPDDLIELRDAVLGEGLLRDRTARVIDELAPAFRLMQHTTVRYERELSREELLDVLASTYRGARGSQEARVSALETMRVTMSRDVLVFA